MEVGVREGGEKIGETELITRYESEGGRGHTGGGVMAPPDTPRW